jgi:hypothetical protein
LLTLFSSSDEKERYLRGLEGKNPASVALAAALTMIILSGNRENDDMQVKSVV